jgi:hypothetical protein
VNAAHVPIGTIPRGHAHGRRALEPCATVRLDRLLGLERTPERAAADGDTDRMFRGCGEQHGAPSVETDLPVTRFQQHGIAPPERLGSRPGAGVPGRVEIRMPSAWGLVRLLVCMPPPPAPDQMTQDTCGMRGAAVSVRLSAHAHDGDERPRCLVTPLLPAWLKTAAPRPWSDTCSRP